MVSIFSVNSIRSNVYNILTHYINVSYVSTSKSSSETTFLVVELDEKTFFGNLMFPSYTTWKISDLSK